MPAILPIVASLFEVIFILLNVVWWIIIIQAVLSWLIAFNVINTYNGGIRSIWMTLQRMTDPLYRPIRRIMPDFGALDLSPMVVLLLISVIQVLLNGLEKSLFAAAT